MLAESRRTQRGRLSKSNIITAWFPAPPDHRRADIDGLRAVAVLGVLGFHAFPTVLRGGFVGVDVFFVISGYLISGILFESIESGSFGLTDFYARRVRRIFPALVAVFAAVLAAGYLTLLAHEWLPLLRETMAGAAFVANFLFWHEAGYFDGASDLKPLLHLWSLAIEEQFYLIWPALLWLARGRRGWTLLIAGAIVTSLLACIVLTAEDPTAAFYAPWTRFWELGLGAMLARLALERPDERTSATTRPADGAFARHAHDAQSIAGLLAIAGGMALIDRAQPFPGALALVPTLGAILIIAAGPSAFVNRRLLSHPAAVVIGTLSYPLYLWHWPILCFARIVEAGEPPPWERGALLVLAFMLAALTYRGIERPLRLRVPLRRSAIVSVVAMLAVGTGAALLMHTADPGGRSVFLRGEASALLSENLRLLGWFDADPACIHSLGLESEAATAGDSLFCSVSPGSQPVSVALIGDSTANHLFPGLSRLYASRGERVINIGNGTCAPFHGLGGHFPWNRPCRSVNQKIYEYVLGSPSIHTVILSMAGWDIQNMDIDGLGAGHGPNARFAALAPLVAADLAALKAAGKHVIVTFDSALLVKFDATTCALDARRCATNAASEALMVEPYQSLWHRLLDGRADACVFDQKTLFRLPNGDYSALHEGHLLYRDDHHLSYYGSERVADALGRSPCF